VRLAYLPNVTCTCGGNACEALFGEKMARRDMRAYLRRGLRGDARRLADWAAARAPHAARVVEIGGGVGAIQAELVRTGAAEGTVVDVVPAWEPYARQLAERVGIADRTRFVLADLAEQPDAVAPADVVALRRVVCCSPYGPRLLGAGARLTRRVLVASYPRRTRPIRLGAWLQNLTFALLRREFRVYIHDPAVLDTSAKEAGLFRVQTHRGLIWEAALFERAAVRSR
jgi:magnesium-protoporphyrin O-methyltransferase